MKSRGVANKNSRPSSKDTILGYSRLIDNSFRYGADELENVKSYKYLGLIMSPFGNFNLSRQELKKVALKAL